jgi:hypothetical protein
MPFGADFFATIFYLLLFLAAITSSLSMLQPGIAFLEEGFGLNRKASIGFLAFMTAIGTGIVWWFSKDLKALDTIDFWIGTVMIFVQGMVLAGVYAWYIGIEKGWTETHKGAEMRIPGFYKPVLVAIAPAFLAIVLLMFILQNVFGWNFSFADPQFNPTSYVTDLVHPEKHNDVARGSFLFMTVVVLFVGYLIHLAGKNWDKKNGGTTT